MLLSLLPCVARCCVLTVCWALQRQGWPAGLCQEPRAVCKHGGAQGHLASSIAQRQPGSRAGRQDTALCLLQGLLSFTWSLHLASWHLRCARAALQRLCPVLAGPVIRRGGHSLQQRQSLSCSPTTATATGTDFCKNYAQPSWETKNVSLEEKWLSVSDLLVVYF